MAKFTFRLEGMLAIRSAHRDCQRLALVETQAAVHRVNVRIAVIEVELRALTPERSAGPGAVDTTRLIACHRYAATLRDDNGRCQEELATLAREIDARRQALVEADREVRSLQKLREKQLARFQLDQQRREQREMDEMAPFDTGEQANA